MIDQKAISAKIDTIIFDALELESHVSNHKRNRIINSAIWWYLDYLDVIRRMRVVSDVDRHTIFENYLNDRFEELYYNKFRLLPKDENL